MAKERLQFRHHSAEVFQTREKAIEYLDALVNPDDTRSQKLKESLFGEPIVVTYKDNVSVDEEGNESFVKRLILAIGVEGKEGDGTLGVKYHYIDSAKIEEDVEELEEKVDNFDELIGNIVKAAGFNEDGTYSPVEHGDYISGAKSVKAATRLLDKAIKALQEELDRTQVGAGLNDDGTYTPVLDLVSDPYEYIPAANSLYEADKLLDKAVQALKKDSIKNVVINKGKEHHNVEKAKGVVTDRIAYLDVTTSTIDLPDDYEDYQKKYNELPHHQLHKNMQLSEALAQLEANFHIATGHTAGIHIQKVSDSELPANVREAYDLVDAEGIPADDSARIFIYKDSALQFVYLGHMHDELVSEDSPEINYSEEGNDSLNFVYYTVKGTYIMAKIDVGNFLRESEFKDGLEVTGGEVRVKIDEASEKIASGSSANNPYLTVSENGVKIDGIQSSIDLSVSAEQERAENAESAISRTVNTVIVGAGLKENGEYNNHTFEEGLVYINSATSLDNATEILDKSLQDEVIRATSAETDIQNELDSVESGLGFTEDGKYVNEKDPKYYIAGNTVVDDINKLDDAVHDIQEELDATQVGAGLNPDGSYDPHNTAPDVANFISGATSLNEADYILDVNLKEESDRALTEEGKIKSWIGYSGDAGYIADKNAHFISEANDLYNADQLLDAKINQIANERKDIYEGIVDGAGLTYDASGAVVYKNHTLDEGFNFINSATSIDNATEILDNALQSTNNGAGLNIDGSYKAKEDARYINTATSIADATEILDGELGRVEDALDEEVNRAKEKENAIISGAGLSDSGAYTANTGSNYIIEATSLVDADNRIDAALKAEFDRAVAAETAIASDLSALSAETLSNHVESEGNSIIVTKRAELTNLEVNIDNATLKQNDNKKIETTLFIDKVDNVGENVRDTYQLKDGNGKIWGKSIVIYKDQTLKNVELKGQILEFTYILADGSETTVGVDMSEFLYEGEFKDGLTTDDHVVKIKLADGNEKFLTVDEAGLKLSGVQAAIDAAQTAEMERAIARENEIENNLTTLSGSVIAMDISHTVKTSDGSINVNKTTDGTYVSVNIDNTTLVKSGDGVLSNGIKVKELESTEISDDNIWRSFKLADANGNYLPNSVEIQVPKTRTIKKIDVIEKESVQYLRCEYEVLGESTTYTVDFDINELLAENDIADGLTVDNHKVKVKIDPESESFVSVTESGIRIKGINDAIDAGKTVVKKGTESNHVTVEEEKATDGHVIYTINDSDIASAAKLEEEISTRTSEVADVREKLLEETTRAKDAERELQGQVDTEKNRAQIAESELRSTLTAEIEKEASARDAADKVLDAAIKTEANTRETQDQLLDNKIDNESRTRESEDKALEEKIKTETDRANAADEKLQKEIDATQKSAGMNDDGSVTWDNHIKNFESDSTLKGAVESLDDAIEDLKGSLDSKDSSLKGRLDDLEEKVKNLENKDTNIESTIFNALLKMIKGTTKEIKISVDNENKQITIGFEDDAIFGNIN